MFHGSVGYFIYGCQITTFFFNILQTEILNIVNNCKEVGNNGLILQNCRQVFIEIKMKNFINKGNVASFQILVQVYVLSEYLQIQNVSKKV